MVTPSTSWPIRPASRCGWRAGAEAVFAAVAGEVAERVVELNHPEQLGERNDAIAITVGHVDAGIVSFSLAFRAHHLRLERKTVGAHVYFLEVISSEITGSETYVHLKYGGGTWTMLTHGVRDFTPGSHITVYLEPEDVMRFHTNGVAMAPREAA